MPGKYGRWGSTDQTKSNIFWREMFFSEDCTSRSFWENKSTLSVCVQFKSEWKLTIPRWSHHALCLNFLWCQLRRFIHFNPLLFALSIVTKDSFFVTCNYNLEKRIVSLSSKKWKCDLPYSSHQESEEPKNRTCSLFLYFSSGLGFFEIKCSFSSTFVRVAFHQFFKSILIELWWTSWSEFISQWYITWTKLWKSVLNFVLNNDSLGYKRQDFAWLFL